MLYRTFEDYRNAWTLSESSDPPVPLNVDIELASICNLRCPFCFIPDPSFEKFIAQKSDDGKPLRRLMPKEMAFKIIDECAEMGVPALKFNWRGESTLHPHYSEIIQYAAYDKKHFESFHELLVNTNANCPPHAIRGLMATTKCMISLDSMVPTTYRQMRVGGNLDEAKRVISTLVALGHKNLWVRRVLTKLNYKEPFFEQVKSEWGASVHVSQHYCFDRNIRQQHEISGCDHDGSMPRRYCGYPSQRLVISSTGKVYPCCIDLHETMPVGDINRQSIQEIWNGYPLKDLRLQLRQNKPELMTETCRNCESWMAFDLPQRNFVKDVEVLEEKEVSLN